MNTPIIVFVFIVQSNIPHVDNDNDNTGLKLIKKKRIFFSIEEMYLFVFRKTICFIDQIFIHTYLSVLKISPFSIVDQQYTFGIFDT